MDVQSVVKLGALCAEGPVWIGEALWFVDIQGQRLLEFTPATGALRQWATGGDAGWVLPSRSHGLLVSILTKIHRFDAATGQFTPLHDVEPQLPDNRLNDATVDSQGRLWCCSTHLQQADFTGRLYRCENGGSVDTGMAPMLVPNGPAIGADAKTLYVSDSAMRVIHRGSIADDGSLSALTPHIEIELGAGYPDGLTLDAEGCLWVGLYDGWAARRYDPEGRLMSTVKFPCANVTKIAFGGAGLRTAYATTAAFALDEERLAAQPGAGDVFAFDPGVAGLPMPVADW